MDTNETRLLRIFKNALIDFMDELIGQFPGEKDLVIARIFLKDQVPIKEVMDWFILQLAAARDQIKNRDDNYFVSNSSIFVKLNQGKVSNWKQIWRGHLDKDTKSTVWNWLDSFVVLADKYTAILQATSENIPLKE